MRRKKKIETQYERHHYKTNISTRTQGEYWLTDAEGERKSEMNQEKGWVGGFDRWSKES